MSGASVRLVKTPKLDKDGCLSFRTFLRWQYSESAEFRNSQWRAAHVCRDQTFVFLRNSTGAVSYHPRCPYISFFFFQALNQWRASNNRLLSRNVYVHDEPR